MMSAKETQGSVLIVEDDFTFRTRFSKAIADRGFSVIEAESFSQFEEIVDQQKIDFAVIDLKVGNNSGLEVLTSLLSMHPKCRAVVLTDYGTIATSVKAIKLGAVNYLTKPTNPDTILAVLRAKAHGVEMSQIPVPTLAQNEWEHNQKVLHDCDGNVTLAARRLGMHRRSLQRKLAKDPSQMV